jgi:uncharacterized membrane protein
MTVLQDRRYIYHVKKNYEIGIHRPWFVFSELVSALAQYWSSQSTSMTYCQFPISLLDAFAIAYFCQHDIFMIAFQMARTKLNFCCVTVNIEKTHYALQSHVIH